MVDAAGDGNGGGLIGERAAACRAGSAPVSESIHHQYAVPASKVAASAPAKILFSAMSDGQVPGESDEASCALPSCQAPRSAAIASSRLSAVMRICCTWAGESALSG